MDIRPFDEIAAPFRSEMSKVGIAEDAQRQILDVYRGPISHAEAYATMWKYFHMTPDDQTPVRFDDVKSRMQKSLADWKRSTSVVEQLRTSMGAPARAPMLSGTRGVQWDNLIAEYDRRMMSNGPGAAECRSALLEGAQLAKDGQLLQTLSLTGKAATDAAAKNAGIFELLQVKRPRVLDEDYAPAAAIGGMAAGYGFIGVVGAAAYASAQGVGVVAAVGAGAAVGGVGMCLYGVYLLTTLR